MSTFWTDALLWPEELEESSSKHELQRSRTISAAGIPQEKRPARGALEKQFAFGLATIVAIFASAIYLVCRYLIS